MHKLNVYDNRDLSLYGVINTFNDVDVDKLYFIFGFLINVIIFK